MNWPRLWLRACTVEYGWTRARLRRAAIHYVIARDREQNAAVSWATAWAALALSRTTSGRLMGPRLMTHLERAMARVHESGAGRGVFA